MKKMLWAFVALLLFASCDMTHVQKNSRQGVDPHVTGGSGTGGGGGNNDDAAIAELERNGHYLMLYHLPAGVLAEHISSVRVTDGNRQVARADSPVLIASDGPAYANIYIPLISMGSPGGQFTRTGAFYIEFVAVIDALTRIVVRPEHQALTAFDDGRGVFDVESFIRRTPDAVESVNDPDVENQIEAITSSGGYLHFINLPRQISPAKFSSTAVSSAAGVVARCPDYDTIAVRRGAITSEAFVPLVTTRGTPFLDGGTYFVTFVITVDATARIAVTSNYFLSDFETGVTLIDAALIPDSPASPVLAPHALTISGLPITAGASNFAGVYLFNTEGPVAACPDYTRISIISMGDEKAAVIPLVFDNNRAFNGQPFSDSGSFIVTFSFYPDALQSFIVTPENNCVVEFSGGSGSLDLRNVPSAPHKYLTVTHLPANTQELNITDVFVWNQAGKVAKCEDYSLLEFIRDGETTTLKIPLVYSADTARIFEETGAYFVSFDLNVDALTRILITEQERVLAGFIGGNATLDARTLPQALPVPYLTIVGLPLTTAKNNFSEVFLYNTVGKVAKCKNVMDIIISRSASSATAMIPLVYNDNPAEYFRDSGEFIVTFTINVDVNTQIIKTRDDALSTIFSDGSGFLDMGADRGYFSGELVNPNDMSPPVIKQGTVFEINGGYVQVKTNAAVTPFAFEKTCVAYVYAAQRTGRIEFIYSTVPPVFVPEKNAWYNGNNRALFKFVFVKDAVDRYVAKIPIDASWTPFERYTITNAPVAFYNLSQSYVLNGASNPAPVSRSFDAGWHLFVLTGAGGGGGGGIDGRGDHDRYGGLGGSGGFVAEIVYLPQTSVTLFTGSGGAGSDAIYYGTYQGGGGGGGGSGTFVYASAGYLLCAGGGGGGAGGSANDGGSGGGGAGGSCGPGAGGGMGGPSNDGLTIDGSSGGTGGGYGASTSAYVGYNAWANPANAATYQPGNAFGFNSVGGEGSDGGRAGANGGRAAYAQYNAPDDWKNTNNANGRGANGTGAGNGAAGSPGGNNRNAVCGTGAAGGAGGQPSDSSLSAGKNGGAGSIAVYAVQ